MFLNYSELGLKEQSNRLTGASVCGDADEFIQSALNGETVTISSTDVIKKEIMEALEDGEYLAKIEANLGDVENLYFEINRIVN